MNGKGYINIKGITRSVNVKRIFQNTGEKFLQRHAAVRNGAVRREAYLFEGKVVGRGGGRNFVRVALLESGVC